VVGASQAVAAAGVVKVVVGMVNGMVPIAATGQPLMQSLLQRLGVQ